jgi:hypothetical protein
MTRISPATQEITPETPAASPRPLRYITPGIAFDSGEVFRMRKRPVDWSAWVAHLSDRRVPSPMASLVPGKGSSLLWTPPSDRWESDSADFVSRLVQPGRSNGKGFPQAEEFRAWLAEGDGRRPEPAFAVECIALVHALPQLAAVVPEDMWWELLDRCLAIADTGSAMSPLDDPVAYQLAAGELPLALRYLFPELAVCHRLLESAAAAVSTGLEELLDGDGLPHCSNLPLLRPLLASWTRCAFLMREMKGAALRRDARTQYEWLVRQALRLTRADGSQVLSNGAPPHQWAGLFEAALEVGGDDEDRAIASQILPRAKKAKEHEGKLPLPGAHSEWAATAVLRCDWSRNGPRLSVTYGGRSMTTELECGREVICSGAWEPVVEVDGQQLHADGQWSQTCWFSDKDADYLELELPLGNDWRVQRHLLMARKDRFLFLADAVLGPAAETLQYRGLLPVTSDIAFRAAADTWEGCLEGRRPHAQVLPLALPEWREGTRNGTLRMKEEGIELTQSAADSNLFAPLFLDLDPRRFASPVTWRRLTVAENLEIQPPGVAVGYRVQCGKKQWLIYRSLAPQGNRTLIGHNLCSEFLCGSLDRQGNVTTMVEIE